MATKMRLQRFGKKRSPFYHIVIADGRAPRDGRFIEKIGTYNPIPNPAEIGDGPAYDPQAPSKKRHFKRSGNNKGKFQHKKKSGQYKGNRKPRTSNK